jgi:hypothetical protein
MIISANTRSQCPSTMRLAFGSLSTLPGAGLFSKRAKGVVW